MYNKIIYIILFTHKQIFTGLNYFKFECIAAWKVPPKHGETVKSWKFVMLKDASGIPGRPYFRCAVSTTL